uniref:Ig-like domain-containing protein n=1 Tax=Anopheles farauti TaxID=69004 RepID=A0A182QTD0_9DIPT
TNGECTSLTTFPASSSFLLEINYPVHRFVQSEKMLMATNLLYFSITIGVVCGRYATSADAEPAQQVFRITPNDIEAVQGDEVVLRCEIEHLAGRVQWTKDGFALGFSNEIVGYPRFSLNQNHTDGVYNLRITNTSYDDAALYQCQVGPAKHNHPIRAQAKLTVVATTKNLHGKYNRN